MVFHKNYILLIFCCFLSLGLCAEDKSDTYSIPFIKVEGLMLIEAQLDNNPGLFIFDTGAEGVILNQSEANGRALKYQTLSGEISTHQTQVNSLAIGEYLIEDLKAVTLDLSNLEHFSKRKILGIIGTNVFATEVLHIDNVNHLIELLPRAAVKMNQPVQIVKSKITIENGIPIIPVSLNGTNYRFGLDTGSSASLISNNVLNSNQEVISIIQKTIGLETADNSGLMQTQVYSISEIHISKLKVEKLEFGVCSFEELNAELNTPIDGIISLNQIKTKDIFIDFQSSHIYFNL